jgi:broad specificity phosphatase PhoE
MRLLLIRHGESVANTEGRLQGQFDSRLTEQGRAQGHALARRLLQDGQRPATIYASDLARAAETAQILAETLEIPLFLDERLREYDVGELSGALFRDIEHLYPGVWAIFQRGGEWASIPGEEGNEAFQRRLGAFLKDTIQGHVQDTKVAIVSHGGSLGTMVALLLEMDLSRPTPFQFGNTSLTTVEILSRRTTLLCLNDTCHLARTTA